jgi:hypothetical protein
MSADYNYTIAMPALALALKLDGVGGQDSSTSQRSKLLMKEASDHQLMNWNTNL